MPLYERKMHSQYYTDSGWPSRLLLTTLLTPLRVEPGTKLDFYSVLQLEVIIKHKKEAIDEARKDNQGPIL